MQCDDDAPRFGGQYVRRRGAIDTLSSAGKYAFNVCRRWPGAAGGGTSSPISAQPVRPSRSWRAWLRGKLTSLHAAAQTDAAIPIDALDMAAQGWRLRAAPAAEKLCAHAAIDNGGAKEYNK